MCAFPQTEMAEFLAMLELGASQPEVQNKHLPAQHAYVVCGWKEERLVHASSINRPHHNKRRARFMHAHGMLTHPSIRY